MESDKKKQFSSLVERKGWEGAGVLVMSYNKMVILGVKWEEKKQKHIAEYFGGKVEEVDEDPSDTAARELKEETGLSVSPDRLTGPIVVSKGDFGTVYLYRLYVSDDECSNGMFSKHKPSPDVDFKPEFDFYHSIDYDALIDCKEDNFEDIGSVPSIFGDAKIGLRNFNKFLLRLI